MKAKKLISIIAAGAMAMTMLAGCKSSDTGSAPSQQTAAQTAEEATEETTEETTPGTSSEENAAGTGKSQEETAAASEGLQDSKGQSGKALVVYYSASGHTGNVADTIAKEVGADMFELEPVSAYSSDDLNYTNPDSRVSKEHEDEALRDIELVSATVENWDSYETVFIGYPIWWGIAAWPVDGFVKANDFTGKTVIPFCTSASSGLGESGELLAKMAGTGDWQEGIRFNSGVSQEEVQAWAAGLGVN